MFESPVPHEIRDAIIDKACAQHLLVDVTSIREKPAPPFKGRLLANNGAQGRILVEMPANAGAASMIGSGDEVRVMLTDKGDLYGFNTLVMGQARVTGEAASKPGSLILSYPREVMKVQRRKHPRVRLSGLSAVKVLCIAANVNPNGVETGGTVRFTAIIGDISSGGMGLRVGLKQALLAQVGRRWTVSFVLPGVSEPISLEVEVRFAGRGIRVNEASVGTRFVNWEGATAGRKAMSDIARFVAQKQRDERKEASGLE